MILIKILPGFKIKSKLTKLDKLIALEDFNKIEILKIQYELVSLFDSNNIFGINKLLK